MQPDRPDQTDVPITHRHGPSDPLCLADQPGTYVEVDIAAAPETVWALVSDIDLPARFSSEFLGARWVDGGPALGASFVGRNQHRAIGEWEVPSFVDELVDGVRFGWATVDAANPGSRWCFELEPTGSGTRLRYSLSLGPGPSGITMAIEAMPDKEPRILLRRIGEHHANMLRTVHGIAALAEGRDPG
jgi:hypothetical protein